MSERRQLERPFLVGLFLALAVLAVYLPVLGMEFINFDDPDYVTENRAVRAGLTIESVSWAFAHTHSANWHPLTWLSHMLDCELYGLNPAGHHFTNLLFHIANTVLLFLLLRSLTGAVWRSAAVAALFALHPLHVESVAWVAERKDVLSAFFGLLSLWAYARYVKTRGEESKVQSPKSKVTEPESGARSQEPGARSRESGGEEMESTVHGPQSTVQGVEGGARNEGRGTETEHGPRGTLHASRFTIHASHSYLLALVFLALGLMSKPMLVTWPFVMLLLDFWPLNRLELKTKNLKLKTLFPFLREKIPFFALSAASCVVTILAQRAALTPLGTAPLPARLVNALVSYARYLGKLVCPSDLAVFYPYTSHWPGRDIALAALLLAAITLVAIWQRRQRPYFLAGWLWFLGTLVPVIGVVKVGSQAMADRYTYLAAIGVFIMGTWALAELAGAHSGRRALAALAAAAMLTLCARVAQTEVLLWQNTETLFRHALAATTNSFVAYNNLGFYFADCKETAQAERCLRASLAIEPSCYQARNKLGSVCIDQGKYVEAVTHCEMALKLNPKMAEAHGTLGLALMKQGKADQAIAHYFEALRLKPDLASVHYNLANALAARGRFDEAQQHYRESLHWEPDSADAHNNLAYLLARAGRLDEAVSEFRAALALQPEFWQAHYGLGDALARQGNVPEAIQHFQEALRIKPELAEARNRLDRLQAIRPEARPPAPRPGS